MNSDEIKTLWVQLWAHLDWKADANKMSQETVCNLSTEYGLRSPEERAVINTVLSEWLVSDDEKKRFDALALIFDYRIDSSLPALRALTQRLKYSSAVGAPFELEKVTRVIDKILEKVSPHSSHT